MASTKYVKIEYSSYCLPFAVNGKSIGQIMQEFSDYRKPIWCPVKFEREDSLIVIQLKALAAQMIAFNPKQRPSASHVLDKLQDILGV